MQHSRVAECAWNEGCIYATMEHSFLGCLLGGVYVLCTYRMLDVIVGDSGLCCCVPVQCLTSIVRAQLLCVDTTKAL